MKYITIIIVTALICLTIFMIIQYPIEMYYKGLSNSSITSPYLIDQLIKHGEVRVNGFCNIDDIDVPFTIALNSTNGEYGDLSIFELNGFSASNIRCEYDIIVRKR